MSEDNAVTIALFEFLSKAKGVTDLLAAGAKSIYEDLAPENAERPYLIYGEIVPGTPEYTLGQGEGIDRFIYQVKGVVDGDSAKPAAEIRDAVQSVLSDGPLTIPGRNVLLADRLQNVRLTELVDGRRYNHRGALYRIWTEAA